MNDILKRRLVGLLVLLLLVFVLSWLLPSNWPESGEKGVPSTTLPLAANGPDGTASPAAPSDAAAAGADTPGAAPASNAAAATPATAAPARSAALPESVDAVDASAPPLPAASSATRPAAAKPAAAPAAAPPAPVPQAKPAAKPPVQKLAQAPSPAPAAKPTAPAPAAPAAAPAPKPAAAPPVPAAPKIAAPVPAPPPPLVSSAAAQAKLWYVQIGSFADQGNAQTTLNLLQNIGFRGESSPTTNAAGTTLYRVRLGPFPSEAVAQQAFGKVSHQGYPQARVVAEAGAKH